MDAMLCFDCYVTCYIVICMHYIENVSMCRYVCKQLFCSHKYTKLSVININNNKALIEVKLII